jgi:signal transduction histidine kinase
MQRRALVDDLRQACRDGELRPGDMLPTVRELQERYRLSPRTVTAELRKLADEGLLRTVPRVGVFVADTASAEPDSYLMLVQAGRDAGTTTPVDRVRFGFEERVTQLGAASATMDIDVALDRAADGTLPPVAGVFLAMPDRGEDLAVRVRDEGIGIPEALQDEMFGKSSITGRQGLRGEKSTGVGLYIVKKIIELHSGDISFISIENEGTEFIVKLPARLSAKKSLAPSAEDNGNKSR